MDSTDEWIARQFLIKEIVESLFPQKEETMSTHGRTPYWEGEEFGHEVIGIVKGTITPRQLYSFAKRFANLFGWRDLDTGGDWMQGFMSGIEEAKNIPQIQAPKKKEVNSVADALRQKADELEAEYIEEK